ncbi:MAG: serine protease [Ahrensia sp.]|nr:serine protease [Ahrensia sp.]
MYFLNNSIGAAMRYGKSLFALAVFAGMLSSAALADGFLPGQTRDLQGNATIAPVSDKAKALSDVERLRGFIPKIIDGSDASPGEFPHQVSLMASSQTDSRTGVERHFCGGSIIGDKWVLTAAHCVESMIGFQEYYAIGGGSIDLNQLDEYELDGIWIHPNYNGSTFDYDFAIIKTARPLFDKEIAVVSRADNQFIQVGNDATITGWGVDGTDQIQQILQKVTVKVISRTDCNDANSYDGLITSRMICLGLPQGGKDSCQGDSGGPAITAVANNAKVLFANVSWGFGCAEPQKYGVYGRLIAVRGWIDTVVGSN